MSNQPHLARSLEHLVGQTPAEIGRGGAQLSFLYKTHNRSERTAANFATG